MKKDEQILRIKELISEDTLYGNLVDNELLNEGDGTKKVVKTASDLITTFLKLSAEELKDVNITNMVKSIDSALSSFNTKVTKENITDLLDSGKDNNVYDEIGNILKTNFKGTKKGAGFVADHYLTDEIVTEIDTLVNNMKNLDLHNYKSQFGKLPQSTQDILDTIPNIRSQYNEIRPLFRVTQDYILKYLWGYFKTMFQPIMVKKNWKNMMNVLKSEDATRWDKVFAIAGTSVGGKKTIIAWFATALAKDIMRGYICPDYVKGKLGDPEIDKIKDKATEKIKGEDDENINEQEEGQEESISSKQKGWVLDSIIFLFDVFTPKATLDPLQTLSQIGSKFGVDELKGLGLIGDETWSCPTSEEHKKMYENLIENVKKHGITQEYVDKKMEEVSTGVKKHIKSTIEKGTEVLGVELEKEGTNQSDVIKNEELYNALRTKGVIATDNTPTNNTENGN